MANTSWGVVCRFGNIGEIFQKVVLASPWVISVGFPGWMKGHYNTNKERCILSMVKVLGLMPRWDQVLLVWNYHAMGALCQNIYSNFNI